MRHVQDNAEEQIKRVIDTLKPGAFEVTMDSGATVRVAITPNHGARSVRVDFTGTSPQATVQLQRSARDHARGDALCFPHTGERQHSAERRLPEANRDHRARRLAAESEARRGGGRGQCRDQSGRGRCALRRTRRAGRFARHDEQLHLRRREAPILRDYLRRLRRGFHVRWRRCRANPHDQFAPHRS